MKLDKNLPIPLYHQLRSILETKVVTEEWPAGYQLPTEHELAESLEVSRITVKRAISDLVHAGLLYRQQGKGTFVANQKKDEDIYRLVKISNGEESFPHKTISYSVEAAGASLAKKLGVKSDEFVIKLNRLKIDNNEPAVLEFSYLPYDICPDFSLEMIEDELIYNVLRNRYNVQLDRAKVYITPQIANEYEASLLQIEKGSSVFVMERTTYSDQNRIVEYSKFIERQDKARYFIEVKL